MSDQQRKPIFSIMVNYCLWQGFILTFGESDHTNQVNASLALNKGEPIGRAAFLQGRPTCHHLESEVVLPDQLVKLGRLYRMLILLGLSHNPCLRVNLC